MGKCFKNLLVSMMTLFSIARDILLNRKSAGSIGIIGGADGPTAVFCTAQISPKKRGALIAAIGSFALALSALAFFAVSCKKKDGCPFRKG